MRERSREYRDERRPKKIIQNQKFHLYRLFPPPQAPLLLVLRKLSFLTLQRLGTGDFDHLFRPWIIRQL